MALSYVLYTNQTGTGPFNFTFPYISTAHVKVSKNGTTLTPTTDYTINTSPTASITLTAALTTNDSLLIYRQTPGRAAAPNNQPLVDFTDGSVLTADDLDKNTKQLLYLVQESDDTGSGAMGKIADETAWDAESIRIANVNAPIGVNDAVNKKYVDNLALYGVNNQSGQSWDLVGNGTNQYLLANPAPSAYDAELFIVEIGGALQHPYTNYTVSPVGSNVYLNVSENVASPTKIRVRNFGLSRGTISGSTLTVDGNTFAVDMTNNRIGIGTSTPQNDLNVHGATSVSRVQLTNTTTGNASAADGTALETSGNNASLWNYENGTIQFGTNNTARATITASGNLGIGVAGPTEKLEVLGNAAIGDGTTNISPSATGAGQLQIKGNSYTGYCALDATGMHFGHNSSARVLTFDINELEVARLNTAGNFGIGRTDVNVPLSIKNNVAANTNTSANTANQVRLYDAANAIYGFGVSNGQLNICANQGANGEIAFYTGGTDTVAPSARVVIPSGSSGIRFPATPSVSSNVNTLDDYQEGTFVPTFVYYSRAIVGGTAENTWRALPGATYAMQFGRYTKIGNLVNMFVEIGTTNAVTAVASAASTWYLCIANLPYAPVSTYPGGGAVVYSTGWTTNWPTACVVDNYVGSAGSVPVQNGVIYLTCVQPTADYIYLSPLNTKTTGTGTLNRVALQLSYYTTS